MIKVDSMVTLTIRDQVWIGQVVEIVNEVALIRLLENMHYHAHLDDLTLFTKPEKKKGKKK